MMANFFHEIFESLLRNCESVWVRCFWRLELKEQSQPFVGVLFAIWHMFPDQRINHRKKTLSRPTVISIYERDVYFRRTLADVRARRNNRYTPRTNSSEFLDIGSLPERVANLSLQFRQLCEIDQPPVTHLLFPEIGGAIQSRRSSSRLLHFELN